MIHCGATRFQSENTHSDPVQQRSSVSPLHGNCHRLCVLVSVCLHEHKTSGFLLICSAPLQISLLVSEEEAAEDEELRKMCTLTGQHWCISLISSFSTLFFFLFFMHHFYIVTVSYCCYVTLRCVPPLSQGSLQQCHIVLASVSHPSSHRKDHKLLCLNQRQGSSLQPNNHPQFPFEDQNHWKTNQSVSQRSGTRLASVSCWEKLELKLKLEQRTKLSCQRLINLGVCHRNQKQDQRFCCCLSPPIPPICERSKKNSSKTTQIA